MTYKLSKRSLSRLEGVDQRLKEVALLAIQITAVDFGIPEYGGKRSLEDQQELYSRDPKVTSCDGVDKRSRHQDGEAIDFYAYVGGKASWEKEHLVMVACAFFQAAIILGHQIEWGGLWKGFQDLPHIQLRLVNNRLKD